MIHACTIVDECLIGM
jgi:carbonic anhydrase/acetyltransferase-like protein (isoleucine patch superfamily)